MKKNPHVKNGKNDIARVMHTVLKIYQGGESTF
jgi:hypothetical protein